MKKKSLRFIKKAVVSAVTAATIIFGTFSSAASTAGVFAASEPKADVRESASGSLSGKVVILHSNDVGGAIDGYAKMATLKNDLVKAGAEVVMTDAGGFAQSGTGEKVFRTVDGFSVMSSMGYTAGTVGGTELAQGYDEIKSIAGAAKYRLVCSNVYNDNKSVITPKYLHKTEQGVKIGFFGLTDPTDDEAYEGITVLSGEKMYSGATDQINALKKEGADLVIGLTHMGSDQAADLYDNVKDIDFIINGDPNTVATEGKNGEPIQSGGEHFAYIGVIVIGNNGEISDHYLVSTSELASDASVQATVDKLKARITDPVEVGTATAGMIKADSAAETDNKSKAETASASEEDKKSKTETASATETADNKKTETETAAGTDNKSKAETAAETADTKKTDSAAEAVNTTKTDSAAETKDAAAETQTETGDAAAQADNENSEQVSDSSNGTYEVVKGDCLWNIAKKHLGSGTRWGEIYELNKGIISDPSLIYVGQQLVLPPG